MQVVNARTSVQMSKKVNVDEKDKKGDKKELNGKDLSINGKASGAFYRTRGFRPSSQSQGVQYYLISTMDLL